MRRIFFIIALLIGFSLVALGQERTKKVLELKNGSSVTGYVMEQQNGSYMLETEAGDILFYSADEVVAIKTPNQSSGLFSILKQKENQPAFRNILTRKGFGLEFTETGEVLQQGQVSSDFWQDYTLASSRKKSGMWLMISGGSAIVAGSLMSSIWGREYWTTRNYDEYLVYSRTSIVGYIGYGLMGAGLGIAAWGAIRFFSGNARLGKLAHQFNEQNGYASELSLDYTPTGIVLVYKF